MSEQVFSLVRSDFVEGEVIDDIQVHDFSSCVRFRTAAEVQEYRDWLKSQNMRLRSLLAVSHG
jgi:hypothetical protein